MIHIFFESRYNCARFHHCRICVTDFWEGGFFVPPLPHPWAALKKPILNRAKRGLSVLNMILEYFAPGKLCTYTLQFFIFLDISSPNALPCCQLMWQLIFLFSGLSLVLYLFLVLYLLLFCLPLTVFAVKLWISVSLFKLSVSLTVVDVSNKSSSWVVSTEQCTLSNVSWLSTWMHSTTMLSRFAYWL